MTTTGRRSCTACAASDPTLPAPKAPRSGSRQPAVIHGGFDEPVELRASQPTTP